MSSLLLTMRDGTSTLIENFGEIVMSASKTSKVTFSYGSEISDLMNVYLVALANLTISTLSRKAKILGRRHIEIAMLQL